MVYIRRKVENTVTDFMKKESLIKAASVAIAVSSLLPLAAFAQQALPPSPNPAPTILVSLTGVGGLLCTVIDWMFYFLLILAVIFVMVAAFGYLTAAGDPDKVKTASNRIIYAAVAIAVAILAKGVPFIVGSVLGFTAFQGC